MKKGSGLIDRLRPGVILLQCPERNALTKQAVSTMR